MMIGLIMAVKISINNVATLTFPILIVPPNKSGTEIERNVHQITYKEKIWLAINLELILEDMTHHRRK